MSANSSNMQDQRILVLLFVALCIATTHLFQFPLKQNAAQGPETAETKHVVWLDGAVQAGFYLVPMTVIESGTTSYTVLKNGAFKEASIVAEATPFYGLPVPINQADIDLLMTLPGIGPKLARNIVKKRDKIGAFLSIDDIQTVEGVGEKKFIRLSQLITL